MDINAQAKKIKKLISVYEKKGTINQEQLWDCAQDYIQKLTGQVIVDQAVQQEAIRATLVRLSNEIRTLTTVEDFFAQVGSITSDEILHVMKNDTQYESFLEEAQDVHFYDKASDDVDAFIPQSFIKDKDKQLELLEVFESFSSIQRLFVQYYYYENKSISEIAAKTGYSELQIKYQLSKAKKAVVEYFDTNYSDLQEQKVSISTFPIFWLVFMGAASKWNIGLGILQIGTGLGKIFGGAGTVSTAGAGTATATSAGAASATAAQVVGGTSAAVHTIGGIAVTTKAVVVASAIGVAAVAGTTTAVVAINNANDEAEEIVEETTPAETVAIAQTTTAQITATAVIVTTTAETTTTETASSAEATTEATTQATTEAMVEEVVQQEEEPAPAPEPAPEPEPTPAPEPAPAPVQTKVYTQGEIVNSVVAQFTSANGITPGNVQSEQNGNIVTVQLSDGNDTSMNFYAVYEVNTETGMGVDTLSGTAIDCR